jgi:hypothetical protein
MTLPTSWRPADPSEPVLQPTVGAQPLALTEEAH